VQRSGCAVDEASVVRWAFEVGSVVKEEDEDASDCVLCRLKDICLSLSCGSS
jgi:hypothetical protein